MSGAARPARPFFMHLGTFVGVLTFAVLAVRAGTSLPGLGRAFLAGCLVHVAYLASARRAGELKQFDWPVLALLGTGAAAALVGAERVVGFAALHFGALLFTGLGLTALVPLLLGREPFTLYYARRQLPAWQLRLPSATGVARVVAVWWVGVFAIAAFLATRDPYDWRWTLLYPNLAVLLLGIPAAAWLPPLWLRLFPAPLPETIEALILGMPFAFDRRAAGDVSATIQFRVSGAEAGDWHLRIAGGRCEGAEGVAPAADVTVRTPDHVWRRVARGELDGAVALRDGLYSAEGDVLVLARLAEWFPRGGRPDTLAAAGRDR